MTRKGKERSEFKHLAVASAALLSAILTLHNVATIYIGNFESFSFELKHVFLVSLAAFLAIHVQLSVTALLLLVGPH